MSMELSLDGLNIGAAESLPFAPAAVEGAEFEGGFERFLLLLGHAYTFI